MISEKIRDSFADYAVCKDKSAYSLFDGRTLPTFVKDYILNKFSDGENRDEDAIREYLDAKMPQNSDSLTTRLLQGEMVNISTRIVVKTKLEDGKVAFMLPDQNMTSGNMFIHQKVFADNQNELLEGENWGNITMQYVAPEGKKKGFVLMTSYKSFNPYKNVNFEDFISRRGLFSTDEWIDVLLTAMGYRPERFGSMEAKFAMMSRLLPAVEANMNFIELGPKSSGKSYVYNNMSRYIRMISGSCTRAQLVYNHATRQYGAIKKQDLIVFDEISTLEFDNKELENFLKGFLESGKASLSDIEIKSSCGLGLVGNVELTEEMLPLNEDFQNILPNIFRSSAMMDSFHLFIPGWKLPRITKGQIYYGWAIDAELFSEFLHFMRTRTDSKSIFEELVEYDESKADMRHVNAIEKIASAYCKLLFPHIKSLDSMSGEDIEIFKELYNMYCLKPAIESRTYIYEQCKLVDSEFKNYRMPEFRIR